ncbi:MAG: hypothetical protein JWM98_870 [Thermoleophilia bacterium]|nr:hypothetical protein [Thermoleophilia bacterium]
MPVSRPAHVLLVVVLAVASLALVPSAALAEVIFQPVGNNEVALSIRDDGEQVAGAPANHHWELLQETGPNGPDTSTSVGLREIAATAGQDYDGTVPVGQNSQYGQCTRNAQGDGLDCFATAPYVFSQVAIVGGAGNEFLDASRATMQVQLVGGAGNDLVIGGAGNDTLAGSDGDDELDGGCGRDTFAGSPGTDTLAYGDPRAHTPCASHATGVYVNLNGAADDTDGENITGPASSIEAIVGTSASDVVVLGAAAMRVATNDGDDAIEARNGVADTVACGAGNDRATLDAATIDAAVSGCEEVERPTTSTPTPPPTTPTPPAPATAQGNCPTGQGSLVVNTVRLCADVLTQAAGGVVQLRGKVSVDGFLDIDMTTPLVVDVARRTATYVGPAALTGRSKGTAQALLRESRNATFSLASNFTITSASATPAARIGSVAMGSYDSASGLVTNVAASKVRLDVGVASGSATYAAGAQFINGALSATGTAGFSRSGGIISTVHGCLDAALPLGGLSRITELRHTCIAYSPSLATWELTAKATLAGMLTTSASARTANGPDINSLFLAFSGQNTPPSLGYSTQVNEGALRVDGIKSGPTTFEGTVGASYQLVPSLVPGAASVANLHVYGTLAGNVDRRELRIQGTGTLTVYGTEVTQGDIDLRVSSGTPEVPAGMNANVDLYAFSGFVSGNATVAIDGAGFFASGKYTVGFPAGAPITNQVNGTIEDVLFCDWGAVNWCPYITGLTTSAEAAVSNKGVGARLNVSVLYGTFWWIGSTKAFHVDLGFGSSKQLVSVLRARLAGGFVPRALSSGALKPAGPGSATSTWTIPPAAKIASLHLDGSRTGQLKVTDPTGRVVIDTAVGFTAPGVGFGRDPKGGGKASFGLFAPAIKPGTWTVSTAGAAPFTSVESLMSLPTPQGVVTSARVVGKPATSRALVAGRSKLRIAYRVPAGSQVALRASTLDGTLSRPITSGRTRSGSTVWTVDGTWAGRIRVVAVTERDGIPFATEPYATVFTVTRPALTTPKRLVTKRAKHGTVVTAWTRVTGARSYEVSMCIGLARRPTRFVTTAPRLVTTPRTALGIRMRVRAAATSSWSPWSAPVTLRALHPSKAAAPKPGAKPRCTL